MNKIKLNLEDPKIRAIWETILEAKREVASWPAWKRGEDVVPSSDDTAASSTAAPEQDPER
ncbi:MAG TPA: hypothetical protein VNO30_39105 [Kofleriaceae bacterium]|nr:hypothetical protein [Kofleriaceae bacterium]